MLCQAPKEASDIDVYILRSFLQKGRQLRKKCGQLKITENYVRNGPLFINGFSGDFEIPIPSTGKDDCFIVPSCDCLRHMSAQLASCRAYCSGSFRKIIILQTVLKYAVESAKNSAVEELIRDVSSGSTHICFNEFNKDMFSPARRDPSTGDIESLERHRDRLVAIAVHHLAEAMGLSVAVLLTHKGDSMAPLPECSSLRIFFMNELVVIPDASLVSISAREAMYTVRRDCDEVIAALSHKNDRTDAANRGFYRPHFPFRDLCQQHKRGKLLRGRIVVDKGNSDRADVLLAAQENTGPHGSISTIRILGRENINRAINGDIVFVKLHPKSSWVYLWQTMATALDDDYDDNNSLDGENLDGYKKEINQQVYTKDVSLVDDIYLIPTGEVVGVYDSPTANREIVAYMPFAQSLGLFRKEISSEAASVGREEHILVIPSDRSLPRFRVTTRQRSWFQGKKIVIRMDTWPSDSEFPRAHVVRCLGNASEFAPEIKALLLEHSIYNRAFSVQALACLPSIPRKHLVPSHETNERDDISEVDCTNPDPHASRKPWQDSGWVVPEEALKGRRDFRTIRTIFSVDPQGCQDIDDSMHAQWLRDGVLELGVHIADVCAFVEQGSPLDIEAQRRGTTVYLTHCRIDMLPALISSDIASLHGTKDRLAVTVLWEVRVSRPDGKPATEEDFRLPLDDSTSLSWYNNFKIDIPEDPSWCGRTVIKSVAAMTYEQADQLISKGAIFDQADDVPLGQAGRPIDEGFFPRLIPDLRLLTLVSRVLCNRRKAAGSVNFSRTEDGGGGELHFELQGSDGPSRVESSKHLEVHDTIAELMILSNSSVAKIISEELPMEALVRIHAPPPLHKLETVRDFCEQIGVGGVFQSQNAVELTKHIPKFQSLLLAEDGKSISHDDRRQALELMTGVLIRAMSEAAYVSTGSLSGNMFFDSGNASDIMVAEEVGSKGSQYLRKGHYGLGVLHYTHFTSPIRRYADIIVHRQLLYALQQPEISSKWGNHKYDRIETSAHSFEKLAVLDGELLEIPHSVAQTPVPGESSETSDGGDLGMDDFMDSLLEDVGDDLPPRAATLSRNVPANVIAADAEADENQGAKNTTVTSTVGAAIKQFSLPQPPYTGAALFRIANDLNTLNRNSKLAQAACQKLFLLMYFKKKVNTCDAVIYGVKENGILVYVPAFDYKGSIVLTTRAGVVRLHRKIIEQFKISNTSPLKREKTFAADDILECHDLSTEYIRHKKDCDRQLEAAAGGVSVLRILRRGAGSILFELAPLQKIQVLITSITHTGGGAEILLILRQLNLPPSRSNRIDSTSASVSVQKKGDRSKVMTSVYQDNNILMADSVKEVSAAVPGATSSKYVSINEDLGKLSSNGILIRTTRGRNIKFVASKFEYRIKGTGRICFDLDHGVNTSFVTEMFRSSTGNPKSKGLNDSAQTGFLIGRAAAIDKMKIWGEEWAEEEDLPGVVIQNDDENSAHKVDSDIGYQIGGGLRHSRESGPSNLMNYGKSVVQVTQRQNKLKVAKRNSKHT